MRETVWVGSWSMATMMMMMQWTFACLIIAIPATRAFSGVTIRQYTNTACSSGAYTSKHYETGQCNNTLSYACDGGFNCVQTLLYTEQGCSGSVTVSSAEVCDVCMGSQGTFMKYSGCSSGNVVMNLCSDSSCAVCSMSVPYPLGCNGLSNAQIVACDAVTLRTYANDTDCSGNPVLRAAIGAGVCEGGLFFECT